MQEKEAQQEQFFEELSGLIKPILTQRKKPLLILFYPDVYGNMIDIDAEEIQKEFENNGIKWNSKKLEKLDIILHTLGGDPTSAYAIAQCVRDFAKEITILIPYYACSAGTLLCLMANLLEFGAQAYLTPIDIHYQNSQIELINIDYYLDFIKLCRKEIESEVLIDIEKERKRKGLKDIKLKTSVEEVLLSKLAEEVGTLNIGKFFRERTLTGHYAEKLLLDYMFKNYSDKIEKMNKLIYKLLFSLPSHNFMIDYHIALEFGIIVSEMQSNISQETKIIINKLRDGTNKGLICQYIKNEYKLPFFKLFINNTNKDDIDGKKGDSKNNKNTAGTTF